MRNVNGRGEGVAHKADRLPRRKNEILARARLRRWLDGQISPFARRTARSKTNASAAN
jgi:hypothetical protein